MDRRYNEFVDMGIDLSQIKDDDQRSKISNIKMCLTCSSCQLIHLELKQCKSCQTLICLKCFHDLGYCP